MSCNCNNFETIGNCAPYGNRADIIAALNSIDGSCCLGEVTVNLLDPTQSDANAQEMVAEAFPDGVTDCQCPCVYLIDNTNDTLFMNCSGDLGESDNWHNVSGKECIGNLTTVGLDPLIDPANSTTEGFPTGLDCDTAILFDEEGNIYYSTDNGVSWEVPRANTRSTLSFSLKITAAAAALARTPDVFYIVDIEQKDHIHPDFILGTNTITMPATIEPNSVLQLNLTGMVRSASDAVHFFGRNCTLDVIVNGLATAVIGGVMVQGDSLANGSTIPQSNTLGVSANILVQPNDYLQLRYRGASTVRNPHFIDVDRTSFSGVIVGSQ